MAWSAVGTTDLGTVESSTASTTLALNPGSMASGSVAVLWVAKNNAAITSGNTNEITGVTDTAGNTWTKAREYTFGNGSANAGMTVALFYSKLTSAMDNTKTITISFSSSVVSKSCILRNFTIGAGNSVSVAGTATDVSATTGTAANQTISGLSNREYLFIRAMGAAQATYDFTETANYTASGSNFATGAHPVCVAGEFRVKTGTGDTVTSFMDSNVAQAGMFVALQEGATARTLNASSGSFAVNGGGPGLYYGGSDKVLYITTAAPGAGQSYEAYVFHTTVFTGTTDITVTYRTKKQLRTDTTPYIYEAAKVRFAADTTVSPDLYCYTFALYTDGTWHVNKNSASFSGPIVSGSGGPAVTSQNKLRIQYNPSTGSINIWMNDGQIVSYVDSSPLPNGRYGFSAISSDASFNDVSGSITDTFDSYSVGAVLEGASVGPWQMYYLEGTTDTAGIRVGAAKLNAIAGQFGVTGNATNVGTNSTYRFTPSAGSFGVTLNDVQSGTPRTINVASGSFGVTTGFDVIGHGYRMPVTTGSFSTSGHTSSGSSALGPGRSRAATMAMFQALHNKTQGELRRKIVSSQPTDQPQQTPPQSDKPAPKRGKRIPLKTIMPPKPVAPVKVVPRQVKRYTGQARADVLPILKQYKGKK